MNEKIGVVGAGLMGAEIALVFALAGHDVLLSDRTEAELKTALERLGYLREIRNFAQRIAGDGKSQPEARIGYVAVDALVHERVIDAAGSALLLRRLDQPVGVEIDAPIFARSLFRQLPCKLRIERASRRVLRYE